MFPTARGQSVATFSGRCRSTHEEGGIVRQFTRYLPLFAALACGIAACSDRSPSMPLKPEVPITRSASVNGGAPTPVDSDVVQSGLCNFDVRLQANGRNKILVVGKGK